MTKPQFDNYKFSAKTEVKVNGEWCKIIMVDFHCESVVAEKYYWVKINHIEDIRN